MKVLFTCLLFAIILQSCKGQPIEWSKTKNWKIYQGEGQQVFKYSIDTLKSLKSQTLNQDSVQLFLQQATLIPLERTPVWMGSYVGSYESSNGKIYKVEISTYGGFFYDESTEKYYTIPRGLSAQWRN